MIKKDGILHAWCDDVNEFIIDLKEVAMALLEREESSRYWSDEDRNWHYYFNVKLIFKSNSNPFVYRFKNGAPDFFKEISDYLCQEQTKQEQMDALLDRDINAVSDFSTRTLNVLHYAGIKTVRDLVNTKPRSLLKYRNFGTGSLREVYNFLEKHNLRK